MCERGLERAALAVLMPATLVLLLIIAVQQQPVEVEHSWPSHHRISDARVENITRELKQLRHLLLEHSKHQQEQEALLNTLQAAKPQNTKEIGTSSTDAGRSAVRRVESETNMSLALAGCAEADVPILRLLRSPCPDGKHGFDCDVRWDLQESFMPDGKRWTKEWQASEEAVLDCQRAFFNAFAERITSEHWEAEWDAQPFRIAAAPPRTIGKMLHQLVTINYYHLTLRSKPGLRARPAPGSHYVPMPQPGFRWNVIDYGGSNVLASPLRASSRCESRTAWHCLWQRFPQLRTTYVAPPPSSALGVVASELYNVSKAGSMAGSMVQYLIVAGVTQVFTQPTPALRAYLKETIRVICHRGGPYCQGSTDDMSTPVAAVHVRHGDSCDRTRDKPGPSNAMFAWDPKKGKLDRVSYRWCYTFEVYLAQLRLMQRTYGVRTVLLATDNADGKVMRGMEKAKDFNWVFLDFPREQYRKRGWMEFRQDLNEHVPFSLAAEIELLSSADMFVGNMGSHVSRIVYDKMIASSSTSVLPPFISVDGYGMCCDFTEDCTRDDILKRSRSIRDCIYWYGKCTGGDQWFYHRG